MRTYSLLLLGWLAVLPARVLPSTEVDEDCTVRFQDNDVCVCSTENSDGPVKCSNGSQTIAIQPCYCVYYDRLLNKTIVGNCFYTCYNEDNTVIEITNSADFNEQFCNDSARTGFFCYECKPPYALGAYGMLVVDCVPCDYHGYKNWLKTLSIELLPLTLLYILAVLLGFNITSSSVAGIVLVLQCITSTPVRTYETVFTSTPDDSGYNWFVKIFFSLLEIVNLNFFRLLYSPVCLHPKLNILELASMEYIIALYPFLLILVTYGLITAYDREYRILVWLWKPFKVCIKRYRSSWNIRTSLLEIFASFVLLSSVKITQVSLYRILSYTQTFDPYGHKVKKVALFSANMTYFSPRHLPFALLAIAITAIFVLLPLIFLTIYPCRCFHRCLNACRLRLPLLHIVMDAFQGSYKLHPRDMRYFSAFYLFIRVLMLLHAQVFISSSALYISGIFSLVSSKIISFFQPYKINIHNTIDSILLLLMGIYFISANETRLVATLKYGGSTWLFSSVVQTMSITLIVLYFILLLAWKLMHKKILVAINKIKVKLSPTMNSPENNMIESFVCNRDDSETLANNNSTPLIKK